jgi:TolB-like protein
MTDIFLSYNREDRARAKVFAQGFEAQGLSVWWDVGLRTGEAYDEVTETALRTARAVVVLWSIKSVASRWVRAEALLAFRNKTLIPCMIEPCERPLMFELTQSAQLYGWKGNRSDPRWIALLADVRAMIDKNIGVSNDLPPLNALMSAAPQPVPNRRNLVVGASAIVASVTGFGLWSFRDTLSPPKDPARNQNSVAVLPFVNLSADVAQAYFADGLSAEVRAELAGVTALRVVAQTSSAAFKGRSETAQSMARQLGVAFLLDGSVRKAASTARVVAQLINGKTGSIEWSQTFDRPLDDIFAVQTEIAEAVVAALLTRLPTQSGQSKKTSAPKAKSVGGTLNVAAFDDLLRGRALFEAALSAQTDRQALEAFDRAIALDANFAAAYAWRARTLSVIASQSGDAAGMLETKRKALAAARRGVELAPEFGDGYSALGFVLFSSGLDARTARHAFDKSLQYGSGDGDLLTGFAMFCGRTGRKEDAAKSIGKALELDPLNATVFRSAGQIAAMARDYEKALGYYQRVLTMSPKMSVVHALKGTALLWSGQLDQARIAFANEPNAIFGLPGLAIIDKKQGRNGPAQASLDKLIADFGDSGLYQQAQIYGSWGEAQKAISTLERAYVVGDSGLTSLFTDPSFDQIRLEARFTQLLKRIGFV